MSIYYEHYKWIKMYRHNHVFNIHGIRARGRTKALHVVKKTLDIALIIMSKNVVSHFTVTYV